LIDIVIQLTIGSKKVLKSLKVISGKF
jgi:hypothetical protein